MKEPVFICGCGRSGTTLLRNILDNHPGLSIYFESSFFLRVWETRRTEFLEKDDDIDNAISRVRHMELENIRPEDIKERFAATDRSIKSLYEVVLRSKMEKNNKNRFGDKTPLHFLYLDQLLDFFPDAKVIFMYRDPRNVYSSFKRHPEFGGIGLIGRSVIERALFWNHSMNIISGYRSGIHKDQFMMVKFEDLITEPVETVRSVCEFIGEPYYERMLDIKGANTSFTAPGRGGVNPEPLDRTKHLRKWEIFIIELLSGRFMLNSGYNTILITPQAINLLNKINFYSAADGCYVLSRKIRAMAGALINRGRQTTW